MTTQTSFPYRIVTMLEGKFITDNTSDIYAWAQVRNIKVTGINNNKAQRAALQGQPRLAGFAGPMWDGDAVRYEATEAYNHLSV